MKARRGKHRTEGDLSFVVVAFLSPLLPRPDTVFSSLRFNLPTVPVVMSGKGGVPTNDEQVVERMVDLMQNPACMRVAEELGAQVMQEHAATTANSGNPGAGQGNGPGTGGGWPSTNPGQQSGGGRSVNPGK